MSINMSNTNNILTDRGAYYETIASQEEIYLEETEEELRAILIFCDTSSSPNSDSASAENPGERKPDGERDPEELVTCDSDDPPLSEEAVAEMLKMA